LWSNLTGIIPLHTEEQKMVMDGEKEEGEKSVSPRADEKNNVSLSRSVSCSSDYSSASLNEFDVDDYSTPGANNHTDTADDMQGIALLRQIFPEESIDALRRLHRGRLKKPPSDETGHREEDERKQPIYLPGRIDSDQPPSPKQPINLLGRIESDQQQNRSPRYKKECILPYDFLRLPPEKAVRRYDETSGRWQYQMVDELERRALHQFERSGSRENGGDEHEHEHEQQYYTKVIFRDLKVGLGLTLYEERGFVAVHSLTSVDGRQWLASPGTKDEANGPSLRAGVEPGDYLIGLNGTALLQSVSPDESLLKHAVSAIRLSPDPIVLHLQRRSRVGAGPYSTPGRVASTPPPFASPPFASLRFNEMTMTPSLLDTSDIINESSQSINELSSFESQRCFHSTPIRGHTKDPAIHSFVAGLASRGLIDKTIEEQLASTRKLQQFTERTRQWEATSSFLFGDEYSGSETFIPLHGVRKAICSRIVNTFLDGTLSAYTIWVYDVESGKEWYAPIRYFRDFQDLRAATAPLHPSIAQIPFPKQSISLFGSPIRESTGERESKCRQLEYFLRTLCAMIYRERLHAAAAEIAIHVQSFLGCESALFCEDLASTATAAPTESSFIGEQSSSHFGNADYARIRLFLKRSIQRYTYRLFLLDAMCEIVDRFVEAVRASGPRLEDIELLEAQGRTVLKARAMIDLERIQSFLDKFQDLVMEGCVNDFRGIAEREEYEAIHIYFNGDKGEANWDRLVREAVREQIEIEVYVPVRSILSRWLVNGWRHEDMEVAFKIKELRKRPQGFFRIPEDKMSPSQWSSVSTILKEGVGMSTLPCAKLRAIVEAAREISRLYSTEHDDVAAVNGSAERADDYKLLSADDFLPIFIFCVIQAEMDRPCALCVLLRTLCDRVNGIGEIGYYLASFEASISHIQELDLAEEREEMLSFLSVPLNDD
jgi:hypothetical protein